MICHHTVNDLRIEQVYRAALYALPSNPDHRYALYYFWVRWLIQNKKVRYYHEYLNEQGDVDYLWVDNTP